MFSAGSSTKLSSISKWILRPPLVFKPPLLFRPSFLSKLALFFAALLLLSYTQSSVALTAHTSRVIEGSAPYLTFDGGRTKAISTDSLLSIEFHNGRVITPSTNTSSVSNPIKLPYSGNTLDDIDMIVPSSVSSVSISDLITRYNYWRDDDGDGQGANGVTASGNISVSFRDKDGNTVGRSDDLDVCKAPYRVTLSSTGGYLQTQYGVPNRTSFSGATVDYYINPYDSVPRVCYARPNLLLGGTTGIDSRDNPRYAGPANIWSPTKGFLTQSTNPSSYGQNFPTTGARGLYFDLDIAGIDASQLSWTVNSSGSQGVTVSWRLPKQGADEDIWIRDKSSYVTRVTLSDYVSSLPQTFELVGRDGRGHEVKYGFVLRRWFIYRGTPFALPSQISWCRSSGYRLSDVGDLTNSNHNNLGATPRSSGDYLMRYIGAGFFSEWGKVSGYGIGFVDGNYWAGRRINVRAAYRVKSVDGSVNFGENGGRAICTTP
ncbi:hypothetical protein GA0061081_1161 [Gilliamella bombicola]|uniref:Uncharacterized protein n=2 Tax=Gilliamella bombicola TaxID=1798182 RepID=A0A1C4DD15_9GAMM|nr:hypothetical protein GA0061081_1161 [Gilliamella bombicola]